jgi:hypothetical protein
MTRWASPVIDSQAGETLQAVRAQGSVSLIATARPRLLCRAATDTADIDADPALSDFDQGPLTGVDGQRIEAMFVRGTGCVPLHADMFMAADAPLIAFVESADRQPFRLLIAHGEVVGLVTLSDLQRLPVYSLLFGLVIAVEALLVEWVRRACRIDAGAWLRHLDTGRQREVERHFEKAKTANVAIDRLSCASFTDEINAALGLGLLAQGDEHHARLQALVELRNDVCHAKEFAHTPERARLVPARVRDADTLANWLQEAIGQQDP